jgi:hypothetical protein
LLKYFGGRGPILNVITGLLFALILLAQSIGLGADCKTSLEIKPVSVVTELANETPALSLLERNAYEILKQTVESSKEKTGNQKLQEDAANAVEKWVDQLPSTQNPYRQMAVREHIAVSYLVRSGIFAKFPNPTLLPRLYSVLSLGWLQFTGEHTLSPDIIIGRLPRAVLATTSRDNQLLHAASFQIVNSGTGRAPFAFGLDYIPTVKDFILATSLAAAAFTSTGSQALAVMISMYAVGTLHEHFLHDLVGHANSKFRSWYKKMGWIGKPFIKASLAHANVHHRLAKTSYTDAATPNLESDIRYVNKLIEDDPSLKRKLESTDYGMTLNVRSVVSIAFITMPATFLVWYSMGLGFAPESFLAATIPTVVAAIGSKYLHPYLHMPREQALARSNLIMKWVLGSRLVDTVAGLHYVHHNGRVAANYNLAPGGDYALRIFSHILNVERYKDALTKPNLEMIIGLSEQNLIGGIKLDP